MNSKAKDKTSGARSCECGLTKKQRALKAKHGTPPEFAVTCYQAVPSFISMDEARDAVDSYNHDWERAGRTKAIVYNG